MATLQRYMLLLIAVVAVSAYVAIYAIPLADSPVRSDGVGYFVYLPSWVVYHDASLETVAARRFGGEFPAYSGLSRWPPTGGWTDTHAIGVAVLVLPFYAAGHWLTLLFGYPAEGFSFFYRHSAGLAGACYLMAGLFFLRRMLSRHYPPGVVLATLLCITFGTNLFHAATFDSLWGHVYSFALMACLLDLTECWRDRPTAQRAILIGLIAGLVVLVRHTNVTAWLVIVLYGLTSPAALRTRLLEFPTTATQLAIITVTAVAVMLPQLALARLAAGAWLANPYSHILASQGGFDFFHPHLADVLFSARKGLFFWSPVLILSVAGLFMMRDRARRFLIAALVVLTLHTYLIASWWDWQLGGSYGHRGFTDVLPLLALPMAALFDDVAGRPRLRMLASAFAVMAVALSIVQMIQYWIGIIPYSDVTWDQYRSFFLRFGR